MEQLGENEPECYPLPHPDEGVSLFLDTVEDDEEWWRRSRGYVKKYVSFLWHLCAINDVYNAYFASLCGQSMILANILAGRDSSNTPLAFAPSLCLHSTVQHGAASGRNCWL